MALPGSGALSISMINGELLRTPTNQLSSLQALANLAKAGSTPKVNAANPRISHWYSYVNAVADTIAPTVPSGVGGTGYNNNSAVVTWSASNDSGGSGVKHYRIFRSGSPAGTYVFQSTSTGLNYWDYTVSASTTYYYKVSAVDNANNESAQSAYKAIAIPAYVDPECFVSGTLITILGGAQVPIEQLVFNDVVESSSILSFEDTNNVNKLYEWNNNNINENRIPARVSKIYKTLADKTIIINNGLLEATPEHSQLINRDGIWKFIPLGTVIVGDKLYNSNKEIIDIYSVVVNEEERIIYPLSLKDSHTFFANGILTHNIK
jgi:hypothetical protein